MAKAFDAAGTGSLCKIRISGKAGAWLSPGRASYRQTPLRALKKHRSHHLPHSPQTGASYTKPAFALQEIFDYSLPASLDAGSESFFALPSRPGGCHFAKAYKAGRARGEQLLALPGTALSTPAPRAAEKREAAPQRNISRRRSPPAWRHRYRCAAHGHRSSYAHAHAQNNRACTHPAAL